MNSTNKPKHAQTSNTLGLESALAKKAGHLSPSERLELATVYERWGRQLRFSVAMPERLERDGLEHLREPSLVFKSIERDLTPPASELQVRQWPSVWAS